MTDTCIDGQVQRLQAMLYTKARSEPLTTFRDLYKYLTRRYWAEVAMTKVLTNQGSRTAGIDGITRRQLLDDTYREEIISAIGDELRTQTYRPQPTRRVYIPKANGKKRPLGIATIKDRIVQQMVKMLLEPIFEAQFLPCSYGFRPHRCTWDALAETYRYLTPPHCYYTVIEGDIQNCFGTIQHGRLMHELQHSIHDKRLLMLLWDMLSAGVMENLQFFETTEGAPQGSLLSPLLTNVYMQQLDTWFHTRFHQLTTYERNKRARRGEIGYVRYIRYADDLIVLMRGTDEQAQTLKHELAEVVHQELHMTLSDEKTLVTDARAGFDFLGVRTFVAPRHSNPSQLLPFQLPAHKSVEAYKVKVRELTSKHLDYLPLSARIQSLNRLIEGWANYHRWGNAKRTFAALGFWTSRRALEMIQRLTPGGRRSDYKQHLRPIAACSNLRRWKHYTTWKTPAVNVGGNLSLGVIPMEVISTGSYWGYRGTKIPAAYPLLDAAPLGQQRDTDFATADEVIANTHIQRWKDEKYNAVYFLRRKEVFQRDRYTCTECGYRTQRQRGDIHDLECHHIDPEGGNERENLRTVCLPCHWKLTKERR
jgi:RNA-directed DNA polymerase